MTDDSVPILRFGNLMEFARHSDGKPVYIDPQYVVAVDSGVGEEADSVSIIRSCALGGGTAVRGNSLVVALTIQRARSALAEITLGAIVDIVEESVRDSTATGEPSSKLN